MLVNHAENGVLANERQQGKKDEQNARKGFAVDNLFNLCHHLSLKFSVLKPNYTLRMLM